MKPDDEVTDRQAGEYEREARERICFIINRDGPTLIWPDEVGFTVNVPTPGMEHDSAQALLRAAEYAAQRDQEHARPVLADLKRKAFPPETKEGRVKKSLDALSQPSPIDPNMLGDDDEYDEYDEDNNLLSELLQAAKRLLATLELNARWRNRQRVVALRTVVEKVERARKVVGE